MLYILIVMAVIKDNFNNTSNANASGKYVVTSTAGEKVRAFVPNSLPPHPPMELGSSIYDLMERANRSLGRLDGVSSLLPDPSLFIYFYVRKEALLSSQIEGTQSSLSDLLLFENEQAPGAPLDDVREVSNYVAAMSHGLKRIREDDFPVSLRLLKEIHEVLLRKGRGSDKQPGEFRRSQNWVGGSRPGYALFVPPPPESILSCMANLEEFLHDKPKPTPVLIKAALSHVQFETIHPFLDGNGRVGRLLITLILCAEEALQEPLLYLSLYFKRNREEYYERLQRVRTHSEWILWIQFFFEGIRETAQQAALTAREILSLFEKDRRQIEDLGRKAGSAQRIHTLLQKNPLVTIPKVAFQLGISQPTITSILQVFERLGIVREITGKQRDRVYAYDPYLRILEQGTEPV
jgi:Fic family protein